jgi:hypothetical protein
MVHKCTVLEMFPSLGHLPQLEEKCTGRPNGVAMVDVSF